jgi:hypothetical protein
VDTAANDEYAAALHSHGAVHVDGYLMVRSSAFLLMDSGTCKDGGLRGIFPRPTE